MKGAWKSGGICDGEGAGGKGGYLQAWRVPRRSWPTALRISIRRRDRTPVRSTRSGRLSLGKISLQHAVLEKLKNKPISCLRKNDRFRQCGGNEMAKSAVSLRLWSVAFALIVLLMPQAKAATATCFCVISKDDLNGHKSRSGVCQALDSNVNWSYSGATPQKEANQHDCDVNRCAPTANGFVGLQSVATACCAIGATNGTIIRAYSAVGNKDYRPSKVIGTLVRTPGIVNHKCPVGWLSHPLEQDGGVTPSGKCKKLSATLTVMPLPPDNTALGTYGYTLSNKVWAWGTQANGGAAVTVTSVQPTCHF